MRPCILYVVQEFKHKTEYIRINLHYIRKVPVFYFIKSLLPRLKATRHTSPTYQRDHRDVEDAIRFSHCQHSSVFVKDKLWKIVYYCVLQVCDLNLMFFREGAIEHPGLFTNFIPYENL